MLIAIVSHIIFPTTANRGQVEIRHINGCSIDTSWKNQTNWCEIKLPRNVSDFDKQAVRSIFKRGDAVEVYLGENGNLDLGFKGYITEVSANTPITIKCEDEMWKLKQIPVNISLQNTSLQNLITAIAPGYDVDCLEVSDLGTVRYPNTTIAGVLKDLKDNYNLVSYFQNGKLVVGKIYADNMATHDVSIELSAKNDLKYINNADRLIKIKAVSTKADGSKLETTVGDEGGEERQLTYYNITSEADLKKLAQLDYDKYKVDGFEGDLELFGFRTIQHGDKVNLTSAKYPEQNGTYYVDAVNPTLSDSPSLRTKITIGGKVG